MHINLQWGSERDWWESINRENKCLKPGFSVGREEGLPLEGIRQCLQIFLVVTPKGRGTYNEYQPPLLLNILPCTGKPLQNHPVPNVNEKRVKAAQSCPTLYSPWDSPGKNTGVGSLSLLQGIFPTQRSNQGFPHCRQIFYQLNHQGSLRILEWVAYPFSRGSSWPSNPTRVSFIAGGFFISWATRKS